MKKVLLLISIQLVLMITANAQSVLVQYDATNYNAGFNTLSPSCTSSLTASYSTLGVSGLSTTPYGYCPGRFAACGYFQITAKTQPGYAYCNSATPSLSTTPDYISFTVTPSASNCVYITQFNISFGAYGTATTHGADKVLVGYSTDGGTTWVTGPTFTVTPKTTGGGVSGTGNCAATPVVATGCAEMNLKTWNITPFSTLNPVIFKIIPFDATECDCTNGANGNNEWAMTQLEVDGIADPPPTIAITPTTVCQGSSTNLTASSGGTAISYTWNTGSTSNPLSVSPSTNTTYTVTGTSASGCTNTATGVVTVNSLPTVTASSATICTGSTGTLTAGGATTYTWSTGVSATSTTVNPTTLTDYTVTGTDGNGCKNTATSTVSINPKPVITIANDSICKGTTGTLVATATTTNTYTWNTGATGATFTVANVNSNATYTVTGTNTATTCTNTAVGDIIVRIPPVINVTNPSSICPGTSTILTASGTITSYTWNTGATTASIVVTPTVSPTTYSVTGTSINGCTSATATTSVTLSTTSNLTVTPSFSVACSNVSFTLTASGASANTYTWVASNGTSIPDNSSQIVVTQTAAVTYSVSGSLGGGCTTIPTTITVNVDPIFTIAVAPSPTNIVCQGKSVTLTASGAGGGGSYVWTPSITNGTAFTPTVSANYSVTGTNANGCKATNTESVTVNTNPTVSVSPQAICPGNTATLTATPTTLTSYTWTTGSSISTTTVSPASNASYTVSGTDINGCVSNTATANVTVNSSPTLTVSVTKATACTGVADTLNAVGASTYTWVASNGVPIVSHGSQIIETQTTSVTYTVTGTLVGGCTTSPSTITVNVAPTITLNIASSPTNAAVCQGNSLTLTASGASTYTWTPSITNGVGFVPASSQTYSVMVTDANGCKDSSNIPVTVNTPPTVSIIVSSPTICPTATATLTTSSPSSLTSYTWNTGATTVSTTVSPVTTTPYTVTATDGNGCVGTATTVVNVSNSLTILPVATHTLLCFGTVDTLSATGAQSYTWSPSATSISVTNDSVTVNPTTLTTYTVRGSSGTCVDSATIMVNIATPITPTVTANPANATICAGGSITLTASGASTYTWTGGVVNGNSFTPSSTPQSQSYTVVSTDMNGCIGMTIEPVTVNPLPVITITPTSPSVCLGQDSTTLIASGALTYTWSTSVISTSITVSPSSTQSYTVSGTDGNGCTNSVSAPTTITVNTPVPITIISSMGASVCSGSTTTLTANNGGASTYTWSTGSISINPITVNPINPTTYSVNGIDINRCKDSTAILISISPSPGLLTVTGNTFVCSNAPVNNLVASSTNATGYIWIGPAPSTNTVSTSSSPSFTTPGTYVVYAVNTCTISAPYTISLSKDSVTADIISPTGSLTTGSAPDTVAFTGQGTSTNGILSNASYNWNFGNGNSSTGQNTSEIYTVPSLSVNIYTAILTVTDSKGCWDTATVKITVNEIPTMIIIPNIFSPNGDGINDVFSIKATGISNFDCKIYDRWGLFLHEWEGVNGGWDGKGVNGNNATDGTYFYIINYNDNQGKAINKNSFFELVR